MLTDKLAACLESGDFGPLADLYAPDVLLDAHVPNWRFQVQGCDAVASVFAGWWPVAGRLAHWHETVTDGGSTVVVEFERHWTEESGKAYRCRQVHVLQLAAGRIVEQVVYCAGKWSDAAVAEMTSAAPLVRAR